jgi:hypothetical protein
MGKVQDRSMSAEFAQGGVDSTYISITPDRGGVIENPPYDRLTWPTYDQAERHIDPPFMEAHMRRRALPWEVSRGQRSIVKQ